MNDPKVIHSILYQALHSVPIKGPFNYYVRSPGGGWGSSNFLFFLTGREAGVTANLIGGVEKSGTKTLI